MWHNQYLQPPWVWLKSRLCYCWFGAHSSVKCPEFNQEAIWNAVMIFPVPSSAGFKGASKGVWAFHKWMRWAWDVDHKTVTFSISVHKFKHHRRFTIQNLSSQTAPRAGRTEEITLKLQKGSPSEEKSHPDPGQHHVFPIACYGRGSALLYFLPLCSSCLSPSWTHTPALQTGKTGAQGTAMTHSLAQNGSLEDLHFPALNAKGRFCPDKNVSGSISWEFTAGQGEKPAHPKCYWILETHLSITETSSTNIPGTTENVFAFLWIKIWTEMSNKQESLFWVL